MTRIGAGTSDGGTYTPEMNISTLTGSMITGAAERADRGTLLAASPSNEKHTVPSTSSQANVHQCEAVVGSRSPSTAMPTATRMTSSARVETPTTPSLPMK
jgi:hypothetical protein